MTELRDPVQGLLGYLHEIEIKEPTSVLIFQLPRETKQLSESYLQGVMGAAKECYQKIGLLCLLDAMSMCTNLQEQMLSC